jgi:hypothetical protein
MRNIPSLSALGVLALMSMGASALAATASHHKPMAGVTMHHRIACADGRSIVRDHGYNRVKPLDCRGGTFAYLGHRDGSSFRVLVSARTGRILQAKSI